ncbi:MAG: hypothetical protein ACI9EF_000691 [Pseudohongiellaceae bacterium]|jgi:hypothetical protein
MPLLAATLIVLCVAAPPSDDRRPEAEDDVVTLTDGETHTGQVVYSDETVVVLRKRTRETVFTLDQVEDVNSRVASLGQLLQRMDDGGPLSRYSRDALLELAAFAEHSRLPGEARMLRQLALISEPENEAVNEALGNVLRNKKWTTRRGNDWIKTSQLAEGDEKWKDRWTLNTAHYRLSSNLPLGDAIAAAFDLERLYSAVFQLLAPQVQLREPQEIMEVQLHGDKKSFPEPGSGRRGLFERDDRIAYVNAISRPWHYQLAHEATRQLLYMTTQRAVNGKGDLPIWLDIGLAEAFATGMSGRPGQRAFDPHSRDRTRYRLQATAEKPYKLSRVITFSDDDMLAQQLQTLRYAQCYTLVNFLLQANEEEHSQAFFDFVRSAWKGQASPSRFEKDMGQKDDELQEIWFAEVQQVAGV